MARLRPRDACFIRLQQSGSKASLPLRNAWQKSARMRGALPLLHVEAKARAYDFREGCRSCT
jgi:hypothetical protein